MWRWEGSAQSDRARYRQPTTPCKLPVLMIFYGYSTADWIIQKRQTRCCWSMISALCLDSVMSQSCYEELSISELQLPWIATTSFSWEEIVGRLRPGDVKLTDAIGCLEATEVIITVCTKCWHNKYIVYKAPSLQRNIVANSGALCRMQVKRQLGDRETDRQTDRQTAKFSSKYVGQKEKERQQL